MSRPKTYHFYGELQGTRYVCPCTEAPNEEWRVTSNIAKVNCPGCLRFIRDCNEETEH